MAGIAKAVRATGLVGLVLLALAACAPTMQSDPPLSGGRTDIHERLSEAIIRDGFSHGLRSQRDGNEHFDVINIAVSLDSLKGRHQSLDKLMTDIGRICSNPGYAHLPILVVIGAGDEDDRMYLYAVLANSVKGRPNITVNSVSDTGNEILISIRHPGRGG